MIYPLGSVVCQCVYTGIHPHRTTPLIPPVNSHKMIPVNIHPRLWRCQPTSHILPTGPRVNEGGEGDTIIQGSAAAAPKPPVGLNSWQRSFPISCIHPCLEGGVGVRAVPCGCGRQGACGIQTNPPREGRTKITGSGKGRRLGFHFHNSASYINTHTPGWFSVPVHNPSTLGPFEVISRPH